MQKFDIVLIEREGECGLQKSEIIALLEKVNGEEMYPIEILSDNVESCAMGFITREAANELDFDYIESGLNKFVTNILDDMENETETGEYQFNGLAILLTRNI